jgi:hypothetical protein
LRILGECVEVLRFAREANRQRGRNRRSNEDFCQAPHPFLLNANYLIALKLVPVSVSSQKEGYSLCTSLVSISSVVAMCSAKMELPA